MIQIRNVTMVHITNSVFVPAFPASSEMTEKSGRTTRRASEKMLGGGLGRLEACGQVILASNVIFTAHYEQTGKQLD